MATELLGKKEDLYEVDWVKQQTKSALASLHKDVLYKKSGDEVSFDVDTSIDYLNTLKDKKTYKEVMAENSGATVMAIQILLKNKGYDVGKIDGVLRGKGRVTSKTMEAIKEFQRKNGLVPDGAPGPLTLQKLLAEYEGGVSGGGKPVDKDDEKVKDLTETEFFDLCKKTSFTDDEIKQLVKFSNEQTKGLDYSTDDYKYDLKLKGLTSISDAQLTELAKARMLNLPGITTINDKQAEILGSGNINNLGLGGLTSITDKQAEMLCNGTIEALYFWGLTTINDKQAEEFGKLKLFVNDSLTIVTDKQMGEFAKLKILVLDGLTSITDKQAELLGNGSIEELSLCGLTSITDRQAIELAKVKELSLDESILTPTQKAILKNIV